jgi:hypothetical protein
LFLGYNKQKRERIESHELKKEQQWKEEEEVVEEVRRQFWQGRRGGQIWDIGTHGGGRGEECEDEGRYPDKARENHGKVQDYHHKEMIRMQGLCATTRTRWQCAPLWQRQQQKNKNIDYDYVIECRGDQRQMGTWPAYADNDEDHGLLRRR